MYYILALLLHISKPFLCILNIFGSFTYIFLAIFSYYFCASLYFSQKCTIPPFRVHFYQVSASIIITFSIHFILTIEGVLCLAKVI